MDTIYIQEDKFDEVLVRSIVVDDKVYYLSRDIALLLNYSSPASFASIVNKEDILSLDDIYNIYNLSVMDSYIEVLSDIKSFEKGLLTSLLHKAPCGKDYSIKFVTLNGIKSILCRSNKIEPEQFKDLLKFFHIDGLIAKPDREEMSFGCLLSGALKVYNLSIQKQKRIGSYYADYIIPEKNIIIEYDEHNHASYNQEKEQERNRYLESKGYYIIHVNGNIPMNEALGYTIKEIQNLL